VAGYDDEMLARVVFRRRDRYGRLVRATEDLPPGVEVDEDGQRVVTDPRPFSVMYRQVRMSQGMSREEAEDDWLLYKAANPALGVGGPR
jgi:hypothetical protein